MITGIEYVFAAYSIWICTFIIYIFINKRRKKNLNKTIAVFEKKSAVSHISSLKLDKNEIKE